MIDPPAFLYCRECWFKLPDDGFHFAHHRRKNGTVQQDKVCKLCRADQAAERYRSIMANPTLAKEERKRRNEWERKNRRKHRRKRNKRRMDYYRNKVATPAGRYAYNEAQRIRYRLRAEQEGREVRALPIKSPITGKRVRLSGHFEAELRRRGIIGTDDE